MYVPFAHSNLIEDGVGKGVLGPIREKAEPVSIRNFLREIKSTA
jgi:hypothetical protein